VQQNSSQGEKLQLSNPNSNDENNGSNQDHNQDNHIEEHKLEHLDYDEALPAEEESMQVKGQF